MEKSSNSLLKTIVFVIIVAFTCLLFFGLSEVSKTDKEWVSFAFLMLGEVVVYISSLIPGFQGSNVTNGDILSAGILYAIGSFILNLFFVNSIDTMRALIVWNTAIVLVYLLILVIVIFNKKKKTDNK